MTKPRSSPLASKRLSLLLIAVVVDGGCGVVVAVVVAAVVDAVNVVLLWLLLWLLPLL